MPLSIFVRSAGSRAYQQHAPMRAGIAAASRFSSRFSMPEEETRPAQEARCLPFNSVLRSPELCQLQLANQRSGGLLPCLGEFAIARWASAPKCSFSAESSVSSATNVSATSPPQFVPKPRHVSLAPDHKYMKADLICGGLFAVITLNRPEAKNALNQQALEEFERCLNLVDAHAENEPDFRALLIRSGVAGVFCAGADLKERGHMSIEASREFVQRLRSCFQRLSEVPYPTITCLHGVVFGGGLELALATDFRVASVRPPPSTIPQRDFFAWDSADVAASSSHKKALRSSRSLQGVSAISSADNRRQHAHKGAPRKALEQPKRPSLSGSSSTLTAHLPSKGSGATNDDSQEIRAAENAGTAGCSRPGKTEADDEASNGEARHSLPMKQSAARNKIATKRQVCSWYSSLELCLPEVSLGIVPGAGGTQRLWRVVGPQKAKLLLLTGGSVGPKQAVQWGLVDVMAGYNEDEVCRVWRFTQGQRRYKAGDDYYSRGENMDREKRIAQQIVLEARRHRLTQREGGKTVGESCSFADAERDHTATNDLSLAGGDVREQEELKANRRTRHAFETEIPEAEWESEDAFRAGIRLACRLADMAPLSVRVTKRSADSAVEVPLKTGLDIEKKAYDTVLASKDRQEGLQAFKEKRKPYFKGQ